MVPILWVFHMGLTICFGTILGVLLGLTIGSLTIGLWARHPENYRKILDKTADSNDDVIPPAQGTPVSDEMRDLLPYTASWTHWPDSEKVSELNQIFKILWPNITRAGLKMGLNIAKDVIKPMVAGKEELAKELEELEAEEKQESGKTVQEIRKEIEEVKAKLAAKIPFVEDIVLGTKSMVRDEVHQPFADWIKNKEFNLGQIPLQLGGIKSYDTPDDEVVLETPIMWGSDIKLDIGVLLNFGICRLYVPLEISNFQMKVEARITIKPLVDTFPCVGGYTVSLLKVPLVDMNLKSFLGIDLMSLPGVRYAIEYAMQVVLSLPGVSLLYPSSFSGALMENYGVPPVPKGALEVELIKGENLQGEPTRVRLTTRGENGQESRAKFGAFPTYDEKFNLIVEDFEKQQLGLEVVLDKRDEAAEHTIGLGALAFGKREGPLVVDPVTKENKGREFVLADFIRKGMSEGPVLKKVQLQKPSQIKKRDVVKSKLKQDLKMQSFSQNPKSEGQDAGALYLRVRFLPFSQPVFDDEEDPSARETDMLPTRRVVTHDPPDDLPGVLMVHVIRCTNLKGDRPTTRVEVLLKQEHGNIHHTQKTRWVTGENNPRYGRKFDFVMIRADSNLFFTVYQKGGEAANGVFKKKKKDAMLGAREIPVKDIAKNGMLKDVYTLQDTERGQIELQLKWQTCYVES